MMEFCDLPVALIGVLFRSKLLHPPTLGPGIYLAVPGS